MSRALYTFCLMLLCLPAQAAELPRLTQALTVQQAYGMIPHAYRKYSAELSTLPEGDAHYFRQLFALTDMAVIERVHGMHKDGWELRKAHEHYEAILKALAQLTPPEAAAKAHTLIADAIAQQRDVILTGVNMQDARVRSSSGKLIEAYGVLMNAYPGEAKANREAFYQHLCALDFL